MKQLDFSTFPVLETDRLVLRRLSLEDALVIYQLRGILLKVTLFRSLLNSQTKLLTN